METMLNVYDYSICDIIEMSEDDVIDAINKSSIEIEQVMNPTEKVCVEFVKHNPSNIQFIRHHRSSELYSSALKQYLSSVKQSE